MNVRRILAAVAAAVLLLPAISRAHTLIAPESVHANADGTFAVTVRLYATSDLEIDTERYLYYDGSSLSATTGDFFCSRSIAAGEFADFVIEGYLPAQSSGGRLRMWYTFCAGGQTNRDTTEILPPLPVSVGDPVAQGLSLRNYPNPVRGRTTFDFALPVAGRAELRVYDVVGRLVAKPFDQDWTIGTHSIEWSARRADGTRLEPGIYLARLITSAGASTRRFIVAQ